MPEIAIRSGTPHDADDILVVHRSAILGLGVAVYTEEECRSWAFGLKSKGYVEAMTTGGEDYLVAEVDGRIAGFCSFKGNEIKGLYVDAEASRSGVGSSLIEVAERRISESHEVATLNAALSAFEFYRTRGYSIQERGFWQTRGGLKIEIYEMRKSLG